MRAASDELKKRIGPEHFIERPSLFVRKSRMSLTSHNSPEQCQLLSTDLKPRSSLGAPDRHEQGVPRSCQLKFFTATEFELIELISELIIPTDEPSPGALAAGVPAYLDLRVSEMAAAERDLWRNGLLALDEMSELQSGRGFRHAGPVEQSALLSLISQGELQPSTLAEHFFVAIKHAVVEGFYTSEIGLRVDLRYGGNAFVEEFKGCTHPEHQR